MKQITLAEYEKIGTALEENSTPVGRDNVANTLKQEKVKLEKILEYSSHGEEW